MADIAFTLSEAASVLDPPMTPERLRHLVAALALTPAGIRRGGKPGRPERTFDAATLMRIHAALLPWLRST